MPGNWTKNAPNDLNKSQKRAFKNFLKFKNTKKLTYHYFIWQKIYFPTRNGLQLSDLVEKTVSNILSCLAAKHGNYGIKTKWGCIPYIPCY